MEKDRIRSSLADYCLSHMKTHAAIMKSGDVQGSEDLDSNIFYSLNKKRRWEVEDSVGAYLLGYLNKSNAEWMVVVIERTISRSHSWESYFHGACAYNFELLHPIRKIHYLRNDKEYDLKSVNSDYGQTYHNFLDSPRDDQVVAEPQRSVVSYNIIRAPSNYLIYMRKLYQHSNYWGHNWPRAGYWNRVNRRQDRYEDLRYEDFDDLLDDDLDDVEDIREVCMESRREFYNLEDHLVDNFLVVKKRK